MKTALVVGCNGQDGKLITEFLLKKKYSVIGIDKEIYFENNSNVDNNIDITNPEDVIRLVKEIQPDEIYYLAAYHHSSQENIIDDLLLISESYKINIFCLVNFLESIKKYSRNSKLFYAASSLIYSDTKDEIVDENTECNPDSIYGITKYDGMQICRFYRQTYGIFASVGIMFNHESQYRQEKFLSKKIINAAVRIKNGSKEKIIIGDLSSETDWGYAPDYVKAAYLILNYNEPDDFIVASGKKHSVQYFAETAFEYIGLNWRDHLIENKSFLYRKRKYIAGNPAKLKLLTGWQSSVTFEEMIKIMIDDELKSKNI